MAPEPVGAARLFRGGEGERLIYIGLTVPMIRLDSHMLFCFTDPKSTVPHFTVDAVAAGDHYAFHLDLIPRVDLAVNLEYMHAYYTALSPLYKEARAIEGLSPAELSPLQYAVMSPWMLAHRATPAAMDMVGLTVSRYLEHWLGLFARDYKTSLSGEQLAGRDLAHRGILFSREVDPVWGQVERLIGPEVCEELRLLLATRAWPAG